MSSILEKAADMQQKARHIIRDTNIYGVWSSIGATVNLIGSLKTGLMINNRDIDFHIYSTPFSLADSFAAITQLAENPRIQKITYINRLEEEDRCLEWHAHYRDESGAVWRIDMIHIRSDSPYVGYFEKVADRIKAVLTPETRKSILEIKTAIPADKKVMSIQIYQAVIDAGTRDLKSFWEWYNQQPANDIITWIPEG